MPAYVNGVEKSLIPTLHYRQTYTKVHGSLYTSTNTYKQNTAGITVLIEITVSPFPEDLYENSTISNLAFSNQLKITITRTTLIIDFTPAYRGIAAVIKR